MKHPTLVRASLLLAGVPALAAQEITRISAPAIGQTFTVDYCSQASHAFVMGAALSSTGALTLPGVGNTFLLDLPSLLRLYDGVVPPSGVHVQQLAIPNLQQLVGGCLAPGASPRLSESDDPGIPTWVFDHGWHTAIVVRRSDVDRALWPEVDDFPEATFIEVAWGDREFYMARPATPWLAIKAAFLTSGSVLHVVGFSGLVATHVAESEVVELRLSRGGFDAMTRFIHEEFARDFPVWENKVYRSAPAVCAPERDILRIRRWARQFYV